MQPRKLQVAYEETQSNRVSDFHDFVCSLFPKAILFFFFYFYLILHAIRLLKRNKLHEISKPFFREK